MKLRYVLVIPASLAVILIGIFTILDENPFMPIDSKQQLVQLALSDQRVKQALSGRPYRVHFVESLVPNVGPPFTDTIIRFYFNDDTYIQVRENIFQHKVIDVQNGTRFALS